MDGVFKVEWILDCRRSLDPPLWTGKKEVQTKALVVQQEPSPPSKEDSFKKKGQTLKRLSEKLDEDFEHLQTIQKKIEANAMNLQKEADHLRDLLKKLEEILRKFF